MAYTINTSEFKMFRCTKFVSFMLLCMIANEKMINIVKNLMRILFKSSLLFFSPPSYLFYSIGK